MIESQPNPINTHIITWFQIKFHVKKRALDTGAQGLITLFKYAQTYSHYDVINKKNKNPKLYNCFNRNYKTFYIFGVFEQFFSSIG